MEHRELTALDVTFREDQCRVRKDHGPQNLATLRQSHNLLKNENTLKVGRKRLNAGWREDYLLEADKTDCPVVKGDLDPVWGCVVAFIGCSWSRVGFVFPKPLSPKHRSTFLPLQHAATLILSVDWG